MSRLASIIFVRDLETCSCSTRGRYYYSIYNREVAAREGGCLKIPPPSVRLVEPD